MMPWKSKWLLPVFAVLLLPSLALAQAKYVGSATCKGCHPAIYDKWQTTLHNKSQQEQGARNDTVVVDWKGVLKLKAGSIPEFTAKLSRGKDGSYLATLVDSKDPSREKTYPVVRTYGGWGWKQRYHVKIGDRHYILPIQWNQISSRWVAYNPQWWYNGDGSLKEPVAGNSFEMGCAGCHNTGLSVTRAEKGYDVKYVELNTGCEVCHGPGSEHPGNPKDRARIVNPKRLAYERANEACGQCHSRGVSKPDGTFGYPIQDQDLRTYKVGAVLADYYQFKPGEWGGMEAHAKNHHQQWHDLARSKHFTAKVTCYACHDPHGGPGRSQLVKSDYDNELCLSCHGKDRRFAGPAAIRQHTKHNYAPEVVGLSRCSSCHMVMTASSAEAGDVHSHDFKIIKPQESYAMFKKDTRNVVPNSCSGCHKSWVKDEAGFQAGVKAYEKLFVK